MDIKLEWKNLEEVQMKINLMTNSEARKTFRSGVAEGAKVVKKYAISGGPGPGIGYKTMSGPEYGTGLIGPFSRNWWYDFFEWGTEVHSAKKKGRAVRSGVMKFSKSPVGVMVRRVKGVPARPFMRRALENHVDEIYTAIVSGYKKMIEKLGA
jgi:hypothetical protein